MRAAGKHVRHAPPARSQQEALRGLAVRGDVGGLDERRLLAPDVDGAL